MAETVVMDGKKGFGTIGEKPGKDAIFDLWAFRELELELSVLAINTASSDVWATIGLETSMDPDPEGSWKPLGAFTPLPAEASDRRRFTGFLRYVRWQVLSNADEGTVVFNLRGMAR